MLVTDFIKMMVIEFSSEFKTEAKTLQFRANCKEKLKIYEGDVLQKVWDKILDTHEYNNDPKMAVILKICNKILTETYIKNHPASEEMTRANQEQELKEAFKATDQFAWCCKKMIANDVMVFIANNLKFPEKEDIKRFLVAAKETKATFDELHNKAEFTGFDSLRYQWAKDALQANRNYLDTD